MNYFKLTFDLDVSSYHYGNYLHKSRFNIWNVLVVFVIFLILNDPFSPCSKSTRPLDIGVYTRMVGSSLE